eukprot:TRINITY_DN5761_c0_g1_i4.p1 TRINITY_DN5761_c0_g1~~TRINITY_DN5761_c0_g1_i4.p1  ORF type:complete len:1207 (-),score=263.33 TRINITY_DN5761_c0_g1_i4:401-4021(-)
MAVAEDKSVPVTPVHDHAVQQEAVATTDQSADGSYRTVVGNMYAKMGRSTLCLGTSMTVMPLLCLILAVLGMVKFEVEEHVKDIWAPDDGKYYENEQYMENVIGTATGFAGFYGLSMPRNGGNHMTQASLQELIQRMNQTERKTSVMVDGHTFNWEDVCGINSAPYILPCFRFSVVDAFHEGGYMWNQVSNTVWHNMAVDQLVKTMINSFALSLPQPPFGTDCSLACGSIHATLGPAPVGPKASLSFEYLQALTKDKGSTCSRCIHAAEKKAYTVLGHLGFQSWQLNEKRDYIYFATVRQLLQQLGMNASVVAAMSKDAVQTFVDTQMLKPMVGLIKGSTNPYSWQLGVNLKPQGHPRPSINASTEANLKAVSGSIYWFDEGSMIPAYTEEIIIGGAKPAVRKHDGSESLTEVKALQHVWPLLMPSAIVQRVASAYRPGGPLKITEATAKKVLKEMKKAMEETFSAGWDSSDSDTNQYLSFSDHIGALGSFGRSLKEMTEDSLPLSGVSFGMSIFVSVLFLARRDQLESRMVLGFVGGIFAVLAFSAALGITTLSGIDLSAVQTWTLPFLMVGIGLDDMYVIAFAIKQKGSTSLEAFASAMQGVAIPVTMTSAVNAGMFGIMLVSSIPAVYETAKTALYAIGLLYLTMMTAFPACCYLDLRRQASKRRDCLCCMRMDASAMAASTPAQGKAWLYEKVYRPLIGSRLSHGIVLLISAGLLGLAAAGATKVSVGLDLSEFFSKDSLGAAWTDARDDYFPVWPVRLNWGKLDYGNPDVQMRMVKIWEDVGTTSHITALPSDLVWTARFALWGTAECANGPGMCGQDYSCDSAWVENKLGLKLNTASPPGVCKLGQNITGSGNYTSDKQYCPVFQNWSEAQLQRCLAVWANFTQDALLTAPSFPLEADGITPKMPIRYSRSEASLLYSLNLRKTEDYVNMIEDTRSFCDDETFVYCWMGGIPFDFWEQYLTLESFFALTCGLAITSGFVVSTLFLAMDFTFGEHRSEQSTSQLQKLAAACAGAAIITVIVCLSTFTVFGISTLADIKLSVFSIMSYLTSIGFAVEYSVHIVHRFLRAPAACDSASQRVDYAMEFLFLPTFMGSSASIAGILCMGFAKAQFVLKYFFAPLLVVMFVTYFYGCVFLPTILHYLGSKWIRMPLKSDVVQPKEQEQESRNVAEANQAAIGTLLGREVVQGGSAVCRREFEKQCF